MRKLKAKNSDLLEAILLFNCRTRKSRFSECQSKVHLLHQPAKRIFLNDGDVIVSVSQNWYPSLQAQVCVWWGGAPCGWKVLKGWGNKWCSSFKGCLMAAEVNRRLHKYSELALSSSSPGLLQTSPFPANLQWRHMGCQKGTWNWTNVLSAAATAAPAKWRMGCVVHEYACVQSEFVGWGGGTWLTWGNGRPKIWRAPASIS